VSHLLIEMHSDDCVTVHEDGAVVVADAMGARISVEVGSPDDRGGAYMVEVVVRYRDGWTVEIEGDHMDAYVAGEK
jgi:hypothetical protein